MRAAIYARLSKDTQESTSIERQREECERFAARKGWTVVAYAEDVDVSGSKVAPWKREGFSEILARDDVEVVVAYRIDRLGRSVSDFAALLDRLEKRGISVASATEPFDLTEPLGRAMLYLVAIFAQMEADAISARTRSAIAKLRTIGRHSHGYAPFGYRIIPHPDGAGKTLAVEPEEAALIREAAERVVAGEGVAEVVRDWNARGLKPRHAAEWRAENLRKTLRSPHLLGRVKHHGALVRDEDGEPLTPFPPLLDLETWESVQKRLPSGEAPDVSRLALLTGLARCAGCGGRVQAGGGSPPSYKCADFYAGKPCPAPVVLKRESAEAIVEAALFDRLGDFEAVRRVTRKGASPAGLLDLDAQIRDTVSLLASAPESEEADLLALLRRLKDRRARLERQAAEDVVVIEPLGGTVREVWPSLPHEDRRALLADFVSEIRLAKAARRGRSSAPDPRRVAIEWRSQTPE